MGGGIWLRMLPLECCLCVVQPSGSVTGVLEDWEATGAWAGSVMGSANCSPRGSLRASLGSSLGGSLARSGVRSGAVGVEVEEGSEVEVEGQGWFLAWRSRSA